LKIRKHLRNVGTSAIVIGLSIGVPTIVYSLFLAAGTMNIRVEVFQSLVDADAALLGFLGIIAVFALTRYNDYIRLAEEQIYRVNLEHRQEIERTIGEASQKEYEIFKNRLKQLENRIKKTKGDSKMACVVFVVSAAFFTASIFASLFAMGEITGGARFWATYVAAATCITGVIGILGSVFILGEYSD